jgi:hypothetical protein
MLCQVCEGDSLALYAADGSKLTTGSACCQSATQSGDQRRVGKMNYSAIDEKFMRMAIELPQRALAIPGAGAVGSLISASVAKSEISLC